MSDWHATLLDAQADARRRAKLTNRTHYVYMDGGGEDQEPAYLVSDREPTAMPPGAELRFTEHEPNRIRLTERIFGRGR